MSKYGLGAIYTKTEKGISFFFPKEDYKNQVIKNYYNPIHKKLDKMVKCQIQKGKTVILVDCHSFSQDTVNIFTNYNQLPDICIGTNDDLYCTDILRETTMTYFKSLGYNTKHNFPYSGAMIPDFYTDHPTKQLFCIMIEINRDLYTKNFKKNKNFKKIKKEIYILLKHLEKIKI